MLLFPQIHSICGVAEALVACTLRNKSLFLHVNFLTSEYFQIGSYHYLLKPEGLIEDFSMLKRKRTKTENLEWVN